MTKTEKIFLDGIINDNPPADNKEYQVIAPEIKPEAEDNAPKCPPFYYCKKCNKAAPSSYRENFNALCYECAKRDNAQKYKRFKSKLLATILPYFVIGFVLAFVFDIFFTQIVAKAYETVTKSTQEAYALVGVYYDSPYQKILSFMATAVSGAAPLLTSVFVLNSLSKEAREKFMMKTHFSAAYTLLYAVAVLILAVISFYYTYWGYLAVCGAAILLWTISNYLSLRQEKLELTKYKLVDERFKLENEIFEQEMEKYRERGAADTSNYVTPTEIEKDIKNIVYSKDDLLEHSDDEYVPEPVMDGDDISPFETNRVKIDDDILNRDEIIVLNPDKKPKSNKKVRIIR